MFGATNHDPTTLPLRRSMVLVVIVFENETWRMFCSLEPRHKARYGNTSQPVLQLLSWNKFFFFLQK